MVNLTVAQAAYLAGLIDGEGCISLSFREPRKTSREKNTQVCIQISLAMTHEATIRSIAAMTGTENKVYEIPMKNVKHNHQWGWRPGIEQGYDIISQCEPYMITKKRNAQIFMELVDIRRKSTRTERNWERQYDLVIENQNLNRRGK